MTNVHFYVHMPGCGGGVHMTQTMMPMLMMHEGQSMILQGSSVDKQTEPKPTNYDMCLPCGRI